MPLEMANCLTPVLGRYSRTLLRIDVGYDPKYNGLHSLRSGRVTSVVSNDRSHNVSERLLKLHGRWKSDEAKDMYIEPQCSRLRVTKYLGI